VPPSAHSFERHQGIYIPQIFYATQLIGTRYFDMKCVRSQLVLCLSLLLSASMALSRQVHRSESFALGISSRHVCACARSLASWHDSFVWSTMIAMRARKKAFRPFDYVVKSFRSNGSVLASDASGAGFNCYRRRVSSASFLKSALQATTTYVVYSLPMVYYNSAFKKVKIIMWYYSKKKI